MSAWRWLAPYILVVVAVWSLLFRYWGIQHDAMAYMLQLVARLQPEPLAGDIFLRFTSQEEFTLFPTLGAPFVAIFGIDGTGALLTFIGLAAWLVVAWHLMRLLQGRQMAWLAIGLLVAVPGWYSAGQVFRYAEPFLTARTATEVLCLAALIAWLNHKRVWSALLLGLALLLHPLMAFPAILVIGALALPLDTLKRWGWFLVALIVVPLVGSLVLAAPTPFVDGDWLSVTRSRSGFLFAGEWAARDREVFATTLLMLAVAAHVLPRSQLRCVMAAALCVGTAGVLLAAIASEFLPLKILLQGQPWRWLWLGRVLSIGLMPLVVATLWSSGQTGRAAAALLCSAVLLNGAGSPQDLEPVGVGGLLCAIAWIIWALRSRISDRAASTIVIASLAALVASCAYLLSLVLNVAQHDFSFGRDPIWVQRAYELVRTPGLAVLIIAAAWWITQKSRRPIAALVTAIFASALISGSWNETLDTWTRRPFGAEAQAAFSTWRAQIPVESEVLWSDGPQAAWFLLNRRSYLSVTQAAGTVFSPEVASEIQRRANALADLVSPGSWVLAPESRGEKQRPLSAAILRSICRDEALGFVVSRDDIGTGVPRAEWPGKANFVYLYNCRSFRELAPT